jgi:hypothetical protein
MTISSFKYFELEIVALQASRLHGFRRPESVVDVAARLQVLEHGLNDRITLSGGHVLLAHDPVRLLGKQDDHPRTDLCCWNRHANGPPREFMEPM